MNHKHISKSWKKIFLQIKFLKKKSQELYFLQILDHCNLHFRSIVVSFDELTWSSTNRFASNTIFSKNFICLPWFSNNQPIVRDIQKVIISDFTIIIRIFSFHNFLTFFNESVTTEDIAQFIGVSSSRGKLNLSNINNESIPSHSSIESIYTHFRYRSNHIVQLSMQKSLQKLNKSSTYLGTFLPM